MEYTKEQIYELHKSHSIGHDNAKFIDLIWTHCNIVAEIALQFVTNLKSQGVEANKELVLAGALIHDIGVYDFFNEDVSKEKPTNYICHGTIGMNYVLSKNVPMQLARFCGHHTGVGITKEDIQNESLPLKAKDYIPVTLEEEIVAYADKFHTKEPRFVGFDEAFNQLSKFGEHKGMIFNRYKEKFGLPNMASIEEKYGDWHKNFKW